MRVVQINAVYRYSSTGRTTEEMHHYLLDHGHESYVFCLKNYSDEKNDIYEVVTHLQYRIAGILSRITGLEAYHSRNSTQKVLRKLEEITPEIVIIRNVHSDFVNLTLLLSYLSQKQIVTMVVLHDCFLFTGHCYYYTNIRCEKWKSECGGCPQLKVGNPRWFFDRSRKEFRDKMHSFQSIKDLVVVGVSDWITNESKKSVILSNAKIIKRIYNWIDLGVFIPHNTHELRSKLDVVEDFIVLGIAQSWSENKGLSIFIQIARLFPSLKVIMVGKFTDEQKKLLPANIITPGVLSSESMLSDYYAMADVFINPSVQETFGKVTAEALACGTPVIANEATANTELVGDCGVLVKDNNIDDYSKALNDLIKKGKEYYSYKCRQRAEELFDKNRNMERYMALFRDAIKKVS